MNQDFINKLGQFVYLIEVAQLPLILFIVFLFTRAIINKIIPKTIILRGIVAAFVANFLSILIKIITNQNFPFSLGEESIATLEKGYIATSNLTSFFLLFSYFNYYDKWKTANRQNATTLRGYKNFILLNNVFCVLVIFVGLDKSHPIVYDTVSLAYSIASMAATIGMFLSVGKPLNAGNYIVIGFIVWLSVQFGSLFSEEPIKTYVALFCFTFSLFAKGLIVYGSFSWYVDYAYTRKEIAFEKLRTLKEERRLKREIEKSRDDFHNLLNDIFHDIFKPINHLEKKIDNVIEDTTEVSGATKSEINYSLAHVRAILELAQDSYYEIGQIKRGINVGVEAQRLQPMNVNKLLQLSYLLVRENVADYDYSVQMTPYYDRFCKLKCRPVDIIAVFTNLITNALESYEGMVANSSEDKRQIVLKTRRLESGIVIEIEDSGCSIPPEIQDRVFKAGFSTKKKEGIKGHGLYKVKKIMEEYNGSKIEIESPLFEEDEKPRGTRFIITFHKNNRSK